MATLLSPEPSASPPCPGRCPLPARWPANVALKPNLLFLLSSRVSGRINSSGSWGARCISRLVTMELGGTVGIFLGICASCLLVISAWKRMHKEGRLPPGPPPLPFLGNILQVKTSQPFKSFLALKEKYGPVFTVYLGPRRVVVLCGHDTVKEALVDQAEEFSGRGEIASIERNFNGFGVALANGERWRQLRRFSLTTLRNFGMGKRSIEERIQEEAQYLVEEIRKTKGQPFDPTFFLSRTVSNVISSVVFGSRFDYEDKTFLSLLQMINESFIEMSTPLAQLYDMYSGVMKYLPGRHNRIYYLVEDLKDFIAGKIKSNQATLDPSNPRDFIDCFLIQMEKEKGNPSSEFNLKNLVLTALNLFFAGTETVSSTLRFGLLFLMKYPEVEEMVHKEVEQVIGPNRLPATEDRPKMPYTDAVIHEIQRLTDIVPMGVPHTVIRDTQFRGYLLPKGTDVFPLIGSALRDPKYFSDPENFNPGHFLDGNGRFKKNEAFVPFSSGKRVCLGESMARMELFLYFTTMLQKFSLKSPLHPKDIDVSPKMSGFGNIPPVYQLSMLPR
ncbi:cytochrome P450 2G1-like isoform X2 [Erythrolamprus reginae]|uniref:cytochrome P450 2G1-like isoform X2 n=1 Tax=Erythrolamprus reginae TaxID=121349 RepID=UPI00396C8019